MNKRTEIIELRHEPIEKIRKMLEDILVNDKYGTIFEVILIKENIIICQKKDGTTPIIVVIKGEYQIFMIESYIESICKYYERNICKPKFSIRRILWEEVLNKEKI